MRGGKGKKRCDECIRVIQGLSGEDRRRFHTCGLQVLVKRSDGHSWEIGQVGDVKRGRYRTDRCVVCGCMRHVDLFAEPPVPVVFEKNGIEMVPDRMPSCVL